MRSWGIAPEITDTAALLVTELVTNAAKAAGLAHCSTGSDVTSLNQISLVLGYTGTAVRIEVTDASPVPPVRREASPDAQTGRGLLIIEALTSEWSYHILPSGRGKTVYCVLPTDAPAGAASHLPVAS